MARLDTLRAVVGDLARPFAIWASSGSAAIATVRVAWQGEHFVEAAAFIGAVYTGVAALYGAKAWEIAKTSKVGGDVEIARTSPPPPAPGTANVQAAPDITVTVTDTAGEGELPADQRVRP
jgi:hypothetical protein